MIFSLSLRIFFFFFFFSSFTAMRIMFSWKINFAHHDFLFFYLIIVRNSLGNGEIFTLHASENWNLWRNWKFLCTDVLLHVASEKRFVVRCWAFNSITYDAINQLNQMENAAISRFSVSSTLDGWMGVKNCFIVADVSLSSRLLWEVKDRYQVVHGIFKMNLFCRPVIAEIDCRLI